MAGVEGERNLHYSACTACKKKVTLDHSNGSWFCEKCQKSYPTCNYTWNFSLKVEDFTGELYGQVMGEKIGDQVFNMTAEEMINLRGGDQFPSSDLMQIIWSKNQIANTFVIKARMDTFNQDTQNEENRIRYSVVKIEPESLKGEMESLFGKLREYKKI